VLIDTHSHLNFENFEDDLDAIFDRASQAGVETMVCVGMLPEGGREALRLARLHPGRVYASVGIHPYDAEQANDATLREMRELLGEPEMVLVGGMGIDTVKANVPIDVQEAAFTRQLELAVELDLPVCIHSRDAFAICERVIRGVRPEGWKGFAHCFSDGVEEALGWKALGFTISFAGQITFENKSCDAIRDAARALGPEDVVVETDAPFLAPTPHRGKRNEPAFVVETARTLASIWEIDEAEVFAHTTRNARRVLNI
jgi:TatD DNase family protein